MKKMKQVCPPGFLIPIVMYFSELGAASGSVHRTKLFTRSGLGAASTVGGRAANALAADDKEEPNNLLANNKFWHKGSEYRPFATRYQSKHMNMSNTVEVLHPESRKGYLAFRAEHPRHPAYPNSVDRTAESHVIMLFAFVALGLVVGTLIVADRLQGRSVPPAAALAGVVTCALGPWVALWLWVAFVVADNIADPTRGDAGITHWGCETLIAYLILVLVFHTLNVLIQGYAIWGKAHPSKEGKMGQMLASVNPSATVGSNWLRTAQFSILALDFFVACFGVWLVFLSGAHRDFCQPEVWWTSAALASVTFWIFATSLCLYGCFRCGMVVAQKSSGSNALAFMHAFADGDPDAERMLNKVDQKAAVGKRSPFLPAASTQQHHPQPHRAHRPASRHVNDSDGDRDVGNDVNVMFGDGKGGGHGQ